MPTVPDEAEKTHRGAQVPGKRPLRILGAAILVLLAAWATLAVYFSNLPGPSLRAAAAGVFALGTIGAFFHFGYRRRTVLGFLAAFLAVAVW